MELLIKTRNSVNGTQISIGTFQPGKRDYLDSSTFSGNFPVWRTEKNVFHLAPTGFFGIFEQMESAPVGYPKFDKPISARVKHYQLF